MFNCVLVAKQLKDWLTVRLPVNNLTFEHLAKKDVPVHRLSCMYYLGGLTLVTFIVQLVTGILLMLYYQPVTTFANSSVRFISLAVPGGSLIRNLHAWSASAIILLLFLHIASVALFRSYRRPREFTWLIGALSLPVVLAMAFSGYLLPWNTLSVYATKVGTQILQSSTEFLPGLLAGVGPLIAGLLVGANTIGQETLSRFYALHILILPLSMLVLLSLHLLLVQLHGMSVPLSIHKKLSGKEFSAQKTEIPMSTPAQRFFPTFLLKELALWIVFVSVLIILAMVLPYDSFLPYTLTGSYNPLVPAPVGIKPEWYFYFLYYPLEIFPKAAVIAGSVIFFLALIFYPWLADGIPRLWGAKAEQSKFPTWAPLVVLAYLAVMTLFGSHIVTLLAGGR